MGSYTHVVDADIERYFDSIPQDRQRDRVREQISDGRLLSLLESWLQQDVMTETARWAPVTGRRRVLPSVRFSPTFICIRNNIKYMCRF